MSRLNPACHTPPEATWGGEPDDDIDPFAADTDREPPPEDELNRLVWSFCNLAGQLADRWESDDDRKVIRANRRDLETAFDRLADLDAGLSGDTLQWK